MEMQWRIINVYVTYAVIPTAGSSVCVCVCVCVCGCSGASQVMDVVETMRRLEELRDRQERLAERERELDEQQRRMEQCLRNITEDTINEQYPLKPTTCMLHVAKDIF